MRTKLLTLALLFSSLLAGSALAQPAPPLAPPSGPVAQGAPRGADVQARHGGHRRTPPALRAMLIQRFDRDGYGRLTGPERKQAKRFVVKHRRQLRQAMGAQGQRGQGQRGQGQRGPRGGMRGGGMGGGMGGGAMGPGGR